MPSFGEVFRARRRDAGLSQRDLAEQVGLDFSYISKIENDRIPAPAADTIVTICRALSIDPAELLALTGKIPSDIQKIISTNEIAQEFLREAQQMSLTNEEWEELIKSLKSLRE